MVEVHRLHQVLISMPGIGVKTTARSLTEIVGKYTAGAWRLAPTQASHQLNANPEARAAMNTHPEAVASN